MSFILFFVMSACIKKKFSEMEYCASAASMLPEEIWQIVEGFVEIPANRWAQFNKCGINVPND